MMLTKQFILLVVAYVCFVSIEAGLKSFRTPKTGISKLPSHSWGSKPSSKKTTSASSYLGKSRAISTSTRRPKIPKLPPIPPKYVRPATPFGKTTQSPKWRPTTTKEVKLPTKSPSLPTNSPNLLPIEPKNVQQSTNSPHVFILNSNLPAIAPKKVQPPTTSSHVPTQSPNLVQTTSSYILIQVPVDVHPTKPVQQNPSHRNTTRTIPRPNGHRDRPYYYISYKSYSPYYTPSYSKYPNFYQPVEKYQNNSGRNSVIAGLGGSALGMYLGYKFGSSTSNHPIGGHNSDYSNQGYNNSGGNNNNVRSGYRRGFPRYSVVHHYHHGEKTIPQTIEVKENVTKHCGNNTNFCTPNTTPLCMSNGTIYCIAPISNTSNCNATSFTHLPCLNTTLSIPCMHASDPNCHNATMLNETVAIPCVSNISVYSDFNSSKLQVHTFTVDNSTVDTTVTEKGIRSNFCVTVIAHPVKIPKRKLNNRQFLWYLEDNPREKEIFNNKTTDVFLKIIKHIFY